MSDWLPVAVPEEALDRVRFGVRGRIRRRRKAIRGGLAIAVLALLPLGALLREPAVETLALAPPAPPSAPVWTPPRSFPVRQAVRPAQRPLLAAAARPAERITILTDDPDVVIVLVADGGEE